MPRHALPPACLVALAALLTLAAPVHCDPVSPPPAEGKKKEQKEAPREPTLLEKLYEWVWPLGRYEGDLAKAAVESTHKGEGAGAYTRLYLVDVATGEAVTWDHGGGAVEPVVCPGLHRLVFRRGRKLFTQEIQAAPAGVRPAGPPVELTGVTAVQLFACIHDGDKKETLAIQPEKGEIAWLRLAGNGATPAPAPPSPDPKLAGRRLGETLRKFVSIRPDEYRAYVSQGALLGVPPRATEAHALTSSPVRFSGAPAWVGSTRFLLVTGVQR